MRGCLRVSFERASVLLKRLGKRYVELPNHPSDQRSIDATMTITQFDETDIDAPALQALLQGDIFAPWVRELNLQVTQVLAGEVELALPVVPLHVHGGGVLCGQTMMAAADTAMVLAI